MEHNSQVISNPEFLVDLVPYSSLLTRVTIKVLYLGLNQNGSMITKDIAAKIAKTLPGSPIAGSFNESIGDFEGHEKKIVKEEGQLTLRDDISAYGFIDLNAEVWFQKFMDTDINGNTVEREYLLCTGYLWTSLFDEAKAIVGKSISVAFDEKTFNGEWTTLNNLGYQIFIISDAQVSNICVLGDMIEPCFEGADITGGEGKSSGSPISFSLNAKFFTDMQNLVLNAKSKKEEKPKMEFTLEQYNALLAENEANKATIAQFTLDLDALNGKYEEEVASKETAATDFAKKESDMQTLVDNAKVDYDNLAAEHETLKTEFTALSEFKSNTESAEKDALIASFSMLTDEQKAPVIEKKNEYSLHDLKAELSILCVENKVSFEKQKDVKEIQSQFSLSGINNFGNLNKSGNVPNWALAAAQKESK